MAVSVLALPSAASAASTRSTASAASAPGRPAAHTVSVTQVPAPGTPLPVSSMTRPPAGGYRMTARQVLAIARRSPRVRAALRSVHRRHLAPYEYTKGYPTWQISWFTRPRAHASPKELVQVYVNDLTRRVTQVWTGFQVAWTMARGYAGAFGRTINAWWLWSALCVIFLAPFLPWPRRESRTGALRRSRLTILHADLVALLAFSASLAFFNHADIGMSVPLTYPPLLYLLVRMMLLAFGRGRPREPVRSRLPTSWLLLATIFLIGLRIGLNILDSNVIDVGYAGVIGASKLLHGHALYGHYPANNPNGDTYGPFAYYAYVPATAIFPWHGSWGSLPAAHASALAFDLLTIVGLYWLGRRLRGHPAGVLLAFMWAAYPFTLFALCSNSNDSLVALTLVAVLLVITSPPARGALAALSALTKFAPLALAPLFARGVGSWPQLWVRRPGRRVPRPGALAVYGLSFAAIGAACFVPVFLHHDWRLFWHDSIVYQANRPAPFSVWGLYGGLSLERHAVQGMAVALALVVPFFPRRRTVVEVAALGAAVIIALQLSVTYWFYLYIVWFYALVAVALVCARPPQEAALERLADELTRRPAPAPAEARSIVLAAVPPLESPPH
jgi:hypothetical protein